ncbi:MAG TPA: hypothetical protein VNX68_15260, partial [Nitrosopumilaceae archaeon]|nr:hypothetical protein [Nitrosopumilaceae archaeon]
TRERAGRPVGESARTLRNELSEGYENYKREIRNAGIKGNTKKLATETVNTGILDPKTGKPLTKTTQELKAPTLKEVAADLPGVHDNVQEAVYRALETGDIGHIIDAEKALGTYKFTERYNARVSRTTPNYNGIHAATKMEGRLNTIITEMGEQLEPGKAREFFNYRDRWHTELRPFLDIDPIRRYVNGELTPADLTRRLQANTREAELFRATIAECFQDVGRNRLKNDLVRMGLSTSKVTAFLSILGNIA